MAKPKMEATILSSILIAKIESDVTVLAGDVSGPLQNNTINSNVVTNAKLAQMPTDTIKGNNTGSTVNAIDLTVSQVQAMLGTSGDVTLTAVGSSPNADAASLSGQALTLQPADGTHPGVLTSGTQTIGGAKTFSGAISASNLTGTNSGDQTITLSGDVTGSGTAGITTTIAANAVTNAKAAQAPTLTLKGNNTGGTANVADLTVAQVQSMLSIGTIPSGGLSNVSSSPYSVVSTDEILFVNSASTAITIQLPNPASSRQIYIKDVGANATTNHITLKQFASEKIENSTSNYLIYANLKGLYLVSDLTNWWVF